jgi:uncharacterized protein (TIGR02145 family)
MKTKRFLSLAATLGFAITFTLSCSGGDPDDNSGGGGNGGGSCSAGETVVIGSQTWMKRNLNCNVSGSVCYNNDEANCAKYGRLYNWATAKTVCPSGWHLPSDAEWTTLTDYVEAQKSCTSCAGEYLKAIGGWNWNDYEDISGNGTDDYGLSALPGGGGLSNGYFDNVGSFGYWWSSTEGSASYAWYRGMGYNRATVFRNDNGKPDLISVRCVRD